MKRSHAIGRATGAVAALTLLVGVAQAQDRPGVPIMFDLAGIYTDAFGGRGGGVQLTVSMPLPISLLGARYTAGAQLWYSQTRIVGGAVDDSRRQLAGFGGHLTAAWNVSNTLFPYVRIPVQGVRSEITGPTSASAYASVPIENQVGTATSFAFGIAGGAMFRLGSALSLYGGFSSLAQRLYEVNRSPIWSLEFGIGVAPAAIGRRER